PQRKKWKPRDVHRLSLIKINLSGKHPVFIQWLKKFLVVLSGFLRALCVTKNSSSSCNS
ncbi:MAG: hypothetical protein PWP46_1331, partial [Fusobacteriaceae bacterium]|nr:hypothetical protein [Fusobacteriaceae bacterium]